MFNLAIKGAELGIKGAYHTMRFPVGRMAFGALGGAAYGSITSENQSSSGQFSDVAAGALAGLGLGFATTKLAWKGAYHAAKSSVKPAWGIGKEIARGGLGAAKFAVRNPNAALGIGLGVVGLGALSGTGSSTTNSRHQEQLAVQRGGTASVSRVAWQNSTDGLVQGMHQGRHR